MIRHTWILAAFSALAAFGQSYEYDAAGRLVRVANPDGTGIVYTYDSADNLLSARSITLPPAPTELDGSRTPTGANRISWSPVPGASRYIVYRQRAGSSNWEQIASVTVTTYVDNSIDGAGEYRYRVAAAGANGTSANSVEVTPSTNALLQLAIPSGGARSVRTLAQSAATRSGYATVEVESGSAPYGVAIFQFTQNGVPVSEAAVPASPPTTSGRIFIDYSPRKGAAPGQFAGAFSGTVNVNTGFGIANPSSSAATIRFTLRDTEGRAVAAGDGILNAGAHTATLLSDLPAFASRFVIPAGFETGCLDLLSDVPISVMALRATINQRGEVLFTSTPVADLTQPVESGPLYFPHFADGGGFTTALILMNTSEDRQTGTIEVFGGAGSALFFSTTGGATGSRFAYSILPGGVFVMESRGEQQATSAGWVRIVPDAGQTTPVGAGVFRLARLGNLISESGIPAALPTNRALLYVDRTQGRDTGLAIANPFPAATTARLRATLFGTPIEADIVLPGQGHRAQLTGDILTQLPPGVAGVLELISTTPFIALTLRLQTNARGDLLMSTLPMADQTRAAPEPVVFPHLADGGGFRTELILLGPATSAQALVRFYDDIGAPLAVAELP